MVQLVGPTLLGGYILGPTVRDRWMLGKRVPSLSRDIATMRK